MLTRSAMGPWAIGLFFVGVLALGCGESAATNIEGEQGEAIRPLAASEVVGTIAYGETKRVDYTESPLYRAFKFTGTKGDAIDIRVHTKTAGTDPVAWLLNSKYTTLARNDNADASTLDARIQKTLSNDDTYYIVVRELNREVASLEVSLNERSVDLFAPQAPLTPLTVTQLLASYPGAGTSRMLGRFVIASRTRKCTRLAGCTDWVGGTTLFTRTYFKPVEAYDPSRGHFHVVNLETEPVTEELTGQLELGLVWTWPIVTATAGFSSAPIKYAATGMDLPLYYLGSELIVGGRPAEKTRFELTIAADVYGSKIATGTTVPDPAGAFSECQYVLYGRTNQNETPKLRAAGNTVFAEW